MMSEAANCIIEENLSTAWARAFLLTMERAEVSALSITVTGFDEGVARENVEVRELLDESLRVNGKQSCHTVANTIFPESLWNRRKSHDVLFDRYKRIWPTIKTCPRNRYGVYFQRLISFGRGLKLDGENQLRNIIDMYRSGNHRRSALQATVLDPVHDHNKQRQRGFPCLQQVGFLPVRGKSLTIVGFYPLEYIYERGYGNYLGLCRLGRFMAHELRLELVQMTCFIAVARRGGMKKPKLEPLKHRVQGVLDLCSV